MMCKYENDRANFLKYLHVKVKLKIGGKYESDPNKGRTQIKEKRESSFNLEIVFGIGFIIKQNSHFRLGRSPFLNL